MTVLKNPDFKSSTLLNAIRTEASPEYQARVPLATQKNLAEVGSSILNWGPTRNEFVAALFNRIGKVVISDKMYENPLKEFKKGMLEYGKTIEEVFVDLVEENIFDEDKASQELYKRNLPDVKSVFHDVNRKGFYKTTVENDQLNMAFTSEDGMGNLVEKIISKLYTSDEYDEFLYMKNIINQYGKEGKFQVVTIANPTDEASAKVALTKIKEISNSLTFMSPNYNYAGVRTHTPKEEQIVLIDTAFDALIDVEVLASAFNMDKADFIGRRVLIDDFGGLQGVLCAIVDKNWFMVMDKLFRTEELYNQQGLYYNYWLHHWQVLSASIFHNAVIFQTATPTLTDITISPDEVEVYKGQAVQFNVEATGTNNPPSKCIYSIEGAKDPMTYISSTGLLVIGDSETGSTVDLEDNVITVTATSTFDDLVAGTATVKVV